MWFELVNIFLSRLPLLPTILWQHKLILKCSQTLIIRTPVACPDFLIIRSFFSGPDFHWYVSDSHFMICSKTFFLQIMWWNSGVKWICFAVDLLQFWVKFYVPPSQADYLESRLSWPFSSVPMSPNKLRFDCIVICSSSLLPENEITFYSI